MRTYELTFIVATDVNEEELNGVVSQIQGWVQESNGKVVKTDHWGRRRLAYSISEFNEGHYVSLDCELEQKALPELERNLKLAAHMLRYLLIRVGE